MSFRAQAGAEEPSGAQPSQRDGSEPVGQLDDLPVIEQRIVTCVRLWCAGPDYHRTTTSLLASAYGRSSGIQLMRAFEAFMSSVAVSISEQICRHAPPCLCVGRDEATLMTVIRHAGAGDTFSASVHAAHMVRQDRMDAVIDAAAALAAEMGQACAADNRPVETQTATHRSRALH